MNSSPLSAASLQLCSALRLRCLPAHTPRLGAALAIVGAVVLAPALSAAQASDGRELVTTQLAPITVVIPVEGDEAAIDIIEPARAGDDRAANNQTNESQALPHDPRCRPGVLQYFDARQHMFRLCTRAGGSALSAAITDLPHARGRQIAQCADGALQYFDTVERIFRPCSGSARATSASADSTAEDRASAPAVHVAQANPCTPGVLQYYDERVQLFRPCITRAHERAANARPSTASTSQTTQHNNAQCTAGAVQYFDRTVGLFRPCPDRATP